MKRVPRRGHPRGGSKARASIVKMVMVLLCTILPLMLAIEGAAQEVREGRGILERLVFLPGQNQFEITLYEAGERRTFTADNRVVLIKLDSKLLKDPMAAPLARDGPVVFYQWEQQPRINKPYLRRVVVLFADVSQLKAFLTTP